MDQLWVVMIRHKEDKHREWSQSIFLVTARTRIGAMRKIRKHNRDGREWLYQAHHPNINDDGKIIRII